MAVRRFRSSPGPCSRSKSRSIAVLVVSILLAIALFTLPIAAVTAKTGTHNADVEPPRSVSSDDKGVIDETVPENGTIEVVVRLEDASVSDSMPGEEVENALESHADETQDPLLAHADETAGLTVETEFWLTNAVLLTVDADRVDLESIAAFDTVERIHKNFRIPHPKAASTSVNTTVAAGTGPATTKRTWGIEYLNVPAVWDQYETRGEGVRVAVLDTGVDADHPDIDLYTDDPSDPTAPGGWAEFNETGERVQDSTPYDSGLHGTHVSGTVAGGNASGTQIGVAPDVELLHGLVLSDAGGSFAQVVAGMEWAVASDADIASLSFGASGKHQAFVEPVQHATDSGTIVVGAIGNDGHETSSSPGNVYDALSAGAVDADGTVPDFSGGERINGSDWADPPSTWPDSFSVPDVVAPGVAITSAVPGGQYRELPGTSMATPHVTGTIALLLSLEPDATAEEITTALTGTARVPETATVDAGIDRETRYGNGIVDANAAIDAIIAARSDTDPATIEDESQGDESAARNPLPFRLVGLVVAIGFVAILIARGLLRIDDR